MSEVIMALQLKNTQIDDFLDDYGITHEFSAAYTPQQNGSGGEKE